VKKTTSVRHTAAAACRRPLPLALRLLPLALCLSLLFNACQPNPYREGERLYRQHCANCHMENGEGLGTLMPPLTDAAYLSKNRERLPCILRYGLKDTIVVNGRTYAEAMPGVTTLSDIHIVNILNYVNATWGGGEASYQLDEVRRALDACR
jgi:mono/diheme cytochrome c family protein